MMFLACEMLMFGGPSVLLRQKPRTPCHEVAGLRGFQSPKSRSTEPQVTRKPHAASFEETEDSEDQAETGGCCLGGFACDSNCCLAVCRCEARCGTGQVSSTLRV